MKLPFIFIVSFSLAIAANSQDNLQLKKIDSIRNVIDKMQLYITADSSDKSTEVGAILFNNKEKFYYFYDDSFVLHKAVKEINTAVKMEDDSTRDKTIIRFYYKNNQLLKVEMSRESSNKEIDQREQPGLYFSNGKMIYPLMTTNNEEKSGNLELFIAFANSLPHEFELKKDKLKVKPTLRPG